MKHGNAQRGKHTPTYKIWAGMIKRCTVKSCHAYPYYGGKGIQVCERWRDFSCFLADMGEKPIGMSIDRIDNSKNYFPENCRWILIKHQTKHRTNSLVLEAFGKKQSIDDWSKETGLSYYTIYLRKRRGMSDEIAVSKPYSPLICGKFNKINAINGS
jgi:hypothetical protein